MLGLLFLCTLQDCTDVERDDLYDMKLATMHNTHFHASCRALVCAEVHARSACQKEEG